MPHEYSVHKGEEFEICVRKCIKGFQARLEQGIVKADPVESMAFSFPILERKDILEYMADLASTKLDDHHLLKPTSDVIWPVYERAAEYLLSISRDEMQQPAFDVLRTLKYPELHEESIPCLASIRTISKLMLAAGVSDFSMRDLFKPESGRTIRNLSALINYAKYRQERENEIAELQDESLSVAKQELDEKVQWLKREILAITSEREKQQPAVEALVVETEELLRQVLARNKQQSAMQIEIRDLKHELTSVSDAVSGQKFILQQAKQEVSALRAQIVDSPEKLQQALEEKRTELKNTEAAAEVARQSLQRWKQKLESHTKAEKKVHKLVRLVEEIKRQQSVQKTMSKELKSLKSKLNADEEEDRSLNTKLAELTLEGQHWKEFMERLQRESVRKIEEKERELEDVKSRYSHMKEVHHGKYAEIEEKEAQIQLLKSKIEEVYKTKDDVIANSKQEIARVQHQVLKYYRSLLECCGPIPQLPA